MDNARLLSLTVERFKSYDGATRIDFAPLTVVLGRNNGGKSSIIQSLLLLKQTLADPRPEVPIRLEGLVDSFNLRELTYGWPPANGQVTGPAFDVEWESVVNVDVAMDAARSPDRPSLVKHTGIPWLSETTSQRTLRSTLRIETAEVGGNTVLTHVELRSPGCAGDPSITLIPDGATWRARWKGAAAPKLLVDMNHFLPYLSLDRSEVGPRDKQRAWHTAFLILWAQPLQALKAILGTFQYLGSTRSPPPSLYRPATVAPQEIGVSGEFAAQLLHRRQDDRVHYLPPVEVRTNSATVSGEVRARGLAVAVNEVLAALSVNAAVKVEEVQDIGFRLLFGNASLQHVGRGLTYLLPLVELGLLADPLGFSADGDMPLAEYQTACAGFAHLAIEEPEAHLHPKVQSRLANWLVSLAMANRRLIVETHSDHLVRRLRGMVARAQPGSDIENWLLANVLVVEVEQQEGRSVVKTSRLTREGGLGESWPADFMDEARNEDSAIFDSGLAKRDVEGEPPAFIHDEGGDAPEEER